ncbi:MAG: hypothetical protein M1819_005615 [Sarea resinae]|nr:MAG: hypothetical protein M1819_005615 [Sarea resinae]
MGRLNYTNRKVEGLKLGKIISKDLIKRIPPGSTYHAAVRHPYLELNADGRKLTDEGVNELAAGLQQALTFPESQKFVILEELHLAENSMTVFALDGLADVVRLAALDLKDLDLSGNDIKIETNKEAEIWETFLRSFRDSRVLRRLDLGNNPLGPRAFEILARVYAKEESVAVSVFEDLRLEVETAKLETNSIVSSQPKESPVVIGKRRKSSVSEAIQAMTFITMPSAHPEQSEGRVRSATNESIASGHMKPLPDNVFYSGTRGLRSVPYIIFSQTSMIDESALHLSYVLASHYLPAHLLRRVPLPKTGPETQLLEAYDNSSECRGVVYLPNDNITNAGIRLLEVAEAARDQLIADAKVSLLQEDIPQGSDYWASQRDPDVSNVSESVRLRGHRRGTISTTMFEPGALGSEDDTISGELDRARSKIQGNTLRESGVQSVQLWRATLKMLAYGRTLMPTYTQNEVRNGDIIEKKSEVPAPPTYASKLTTTASASGEPVFAITGVAPHPTIPMYTHQRTRKSFRASRNQRSSSVGGRLEESHLNGTIEGDFDGTDLPFRVPLAIWQRIIAEAAGADTILGDEQQEGVIKWARDRKTLKKEQEALGQPESVQIWRVLKSLGCLAYEIRS